MQSEVNNSIQEQKKSCSKKNLVFGSRLGSVKTRICALVKDGALVVTLVDTSPIIQVKVDSLGVNLIKNLKYCVSTVAVL